MKKCECCGSREFRTHKAVRVCAYCRTEQEGKVDSGTKILNQFACNQIAMRTERHIRWGLARAVDARLVSL